MDPQSEGPPKHYLVRSDTQEQTIEIRYQGRPYVGASTDPSTNDESTRIAFCSKSPTMRPSVNNPDEHGVPVNGGGTLPHVHIDLARIAMDFFLRWHYLHGGQTPGPQDEDSVDQKLKGLSERFKNSPQNPEKLSLMSELQKLNQEVIEWYLPLSCDRSLYEFYDKPAVYDFREWALKLEAGTERLMIFGALFSLISLCADPGIQASDGSRRMVMDHFQSMWDFTVKRKVDCGPVIELMQSLHKEHGADRWLYDYTDEIVLRTVIASAKYRKDETFDPVSLKRLQVLLNRLKEALEEEASQPIGEKTTKIRQKKRRAKEAMKKIIKEHGERQGLVEGIDHVENLIKAFKIRTQERTQPQKKKASEMRQPSCGNADREAKAKHILEKIVGQIEELEKEDAGEKSRDDGGFLRSHLEKFINLCADLEANGKSASEKQETTKRHLLEALRRKSDQHFRIEDDADPYGTLSRGYWSKSRNMHPDKPQSDKPYYNPAESETRLINAFTKLHESKDPQLRNAGQGIRTAFYDWKKLLLEFRDLPKEDKESDTRKNQARNNAKSLLRSRCGLVEDELGLGFENSDKELAFFKAITNQYKRRGF